jgi:methylglutaconyl-CoA hydratase
MNTLRIERDSRGIARLILARPDRHNALSAEMIAELGEAATALGADHGVRAVVLAGDGASFCAGGDLAWMRAQAEADRATRIESALALARMLRALDEVGKPLVARVHGPAYGGGVGILAVCDIVVAARSARFALTETRLGLIPATIGPYVVRRLGEARTREVVLTARTFDAEEAKALGLVSTVVSDDALDAAVEDMLRPVFATAPGAVAADRRGPRRHLGDDRGRGGPRRLLRPPEAALGGRVGGGVSHRLLAGQRAAFTAVTARFVSLLLAAFSWSRISLRSVWASSWPRIFAHSRRDP